MVIKNRLIVFITILVLTSCAVGTRKDQANVRSMFEQKQFDQALLFLNKSELKTDKKNHLLYLMEKGTLEYFKEDYKKASDTFIEANQLVDKLYTKSIREKLASSVLNDNSETFYGAVFERSSLYYYQALSFYKLAQVGEYKEFKLKDGKSSTIVTKLTKSQKKKYFDNVRNTLIAWNSFFNELRNNGVKTFLKDDLLSKIMAANLHEQLGSRRDREIALILYRDARKILINLGPAYKTFNKNYKDYNQELRKFYDKDIKKSGLKSISKTGEFKSSIDYLEYKILKLTRKMRRTSYKRTLKRLKPSAKVLERLKDKKEKNVTIVVEVGHIKELEGKDFAFNLRSAISNIEDPGSRALVEGIGVPILTAFAMGPLGLGYISHHGNVSVYSSHNAGTEMMKEVGIEFEMPFVEPSSDSSSYTLQIYQGETLVQESPVEFLTSLSDVAFISSQEMIENSFKSRGTRIGIKYALAIAAAYGTYKNLQETSGELFAKPAAYAAFLLSQKAIKETEKADVRHWSTLPSSLVTQEFSLPKGSYEVRLKSNSPSKKDSLAVKLGNLEVNTQKKNIFTYRQF